MTGFGAEGTYTGGPEETAAEANRLRDLIAAAQATVTSEDHTVMVTVGPGNALLALELASQARRHDGARLGELIVATFRAATGQLNTELADRAAELGSGAGDTVATIGGDLPDPSTLPEPGPAMPDLDALIDEDELDDPNEPTGQEREFMRRHGVEDEIMAGVGRLKQLQEDAERQLAAYAEMRQAMEGLSVQARSFDDTIEVTVRSGAGVTGVDIDDRALRHGPSRLGPMVMSTIRQAYGQLATRAAGQAQQLTGSRLDIEEMVRSYQPAELRDDEDNGGTEGR